MLAMHSFLRRSVLFCASAIGVAVVVCCVYQYMFYSVFVDTSIPWAGKTLVVKEGGTEERYCIKGAVPPDYLVLVMTNRQTIQWASKPMRVLDANGVVVAETSHYSSPGVR